MKASEVLDQLLGDIESYEATFHHWGIDSLAMNSSPEVADAVTLTSPEGEKFTLVVKKVRA